MRGISPGVHFRLIQADAHFFRRISQSLKQNSLYLSCAIEICRNLLNRSNSQEVEVVDDGVGGRLGYPRKSQWFRTR